MAKINCSGVYSRTGKDPYLRMPMTATARARMSGPIQEYKELPHPGDRGFFGRIFSW